MGSYCVTVFDTIENPGEGNACFNTATRNLTINKGSSYKIIYKVTKEGNDISLAGFALRGQIRPSSSSNIILLDMSTANMLLEINNSNSTIAMRFPEAFTRRVTQSLASYDIEILSGSGEAYRIVQGLITFIPEVTQ
jgi:predicted choloylglycine hydrolase